MKTIQIGSRREVCWDEALIDSNQNIKVQLHHPVFRNVVLTCDKPWEGKDSGYMSLTNDNGVLRLYYRTSNNYMDHDGVPHPPREHLICYAESSDGKNFEKITLGERQFWGRTNNNILPIEDAAVTRGSVFFFKDQNPACPKDELYKALAELGDQSLCYYCSTDGIHYKKVRILADDGAYDSLNVAFWDPTTKQYFLYYRGVHGDGAKDGKWFGDSDTARHNRLVRDIRVRTSKDFVNWDAPRMLEYDPQRDDVDLYINNVQKYYRADHMFIGIPARYMDRYQDQINLEHLPSWDIRQKRIKNWGREGTVVTDALLMTSRDGYSFRRTDEAFLTPGPEGLYNWIYGECFFCYGMAETKSDTEGLPNEISLYVGTENHINPLKICRYTVRLDGFFSWRCDYTPGKIITKPICFDGDQLSINFSTSAAGYVNIRLLDQNGQALDGYDSGMLFGDSVDRPVQFQKPLKELSGKTIKMEISMRDADLYSFRFTQNVLGLGKI